LEKAARSVAFSFWEMLGKLAKIFARKFFFEKGILGTNCGEFVWILTILFSADNG